jgi:hypothetical protein
VGGRAALSSPAEHDFGGLILDAGQLGFGLARDVGSRKPRSLHSNPETTNMVWRREEESETPAGVEA